MSERLAWPPKMEDLERMYVIERMSAAKIAKAYGLGLKYKSPKVAESTILYQLKKHGIARRDKAELSRKVNREMEDDWVRRYQARESLKDIAGTAVDPVTVWNHLKRRGVKLRDKVEAQIEKVRKHEQKAFVGNRIERAYLMGLRYGDFDVVKHGRAVRIRLSTTHPAMANLFERLFSPYGHIGRFPRPAPFTGHEWDLQCDLDESFGFLIEKADLKTLEELPEDEFRGFLTGFFDAEGSILLHKKGRWGGFELSISNLDRHLLELISRRLNRLGYTHVLREVKQRANRGVKGGSDSIWRVEIFAASHVRCLLNILPLRHDEKKSKAGIALLSFPPQLLPLSVVVDQWRGLKSRIKEERNQFIQEASDAYALQVRLSSSRKTSSPGNPVRSISKQTSGRSRPANSSVTSR